jgi:hypothetical protein
MKEPLRDRVDRLVQDLRDRLKHYSQRMTHARVALLFSCIHKRKQNTHGAP